MWLHALSDRVGFILCERYRRGEKHYILDGGQYRRKERETYRKWAVGAGLKKVFGSLAGIIYRVKFRFAF